MHGHTRLHESRKNKKATLDNDIIVMLSELIFYSWPLTKVEVQKDLQLYWSFRDEITVIDGISMKGRRIRIPRALKVIVQKQLYLKHIGIEKTGCWCIHPLDQHEQTK